MTKKPEVRNKKKVQAEIKNYKKDFSSEEIIFAFILFYLHCNKLDSNSIQEFSECSSYKKYENSELFSQISKNTYDFTLKDLEAIFESLIDLDRKKAEGAVYTPDYIIDYIITYSLSVYKGNDIPIICDPSCGSGGFLVRAIFILSQKYNIELEDAVKYIRGIDINPESVSCAKIIIELSLLTNNAKSFSLDNFIICADTLITEPNVLLTQINAPDGVDILATNPPYVKLQNIALDYRRDLISTFPRYTNGSFSFAMLFLIAGKKLLSKRGVLGYITQNNFFTSLASKSIREYLQAEKCIHTIIDFVHTKIFENASAYTCLLFLTNETDRNEFNFKWALNPLLDLNNTSLSKISLQTLNSSKWRLAPSIHLENIYKIEHIGNKLGDVCNIRVGFATLKDSVFLLESDSQIDIEDEITVPALKIADLTNEASIKNKQRKIIFPYYKVGKKFLPYTESEMQEKFPKAYSYLLANKEILNSRSSDDLKYFYEWGRTQGMEPQSNKLLTKTFSSKPNFILDSTPSLFCNGYSVQPKKNTVDIKIIQKILNSNIMNYYSKITSFQLDGDYQCFQKNFIELFNIPNLSEDDIKIIKSLENSHLDQFLCGLYQIKYADILEIINR